MSKNTITFALEDFQLLTLILWGQDYTWAKQADIDRWRDEIPSAESHAIPRAERTLMEENPELFNNIVLTLLRSHGQ